jgi:hypothetical protein
MPHPVIYLDECVDHDLIPFLQARGTRVETAQGHSQRDIADDAQLRFAAARGWIILSANPDHFRYEHRRAAREGWMHAGIITLAPEAIHQPRFFLRCAMLIDWMERAFPDARNRLLLVGCTSAFAARGEIAGIRRCACRLRDWPDEYSAPTIAGGDPRAIDEMMRGSIPPC